MSVKFTSIPLDDFANVLGTTSTEVSSVALGGRIVGFSDEWFAPASDLLKVGPAVSMKGQFGPAGALFDGWETRRHNPTYDWVILRLGPTAGASIVGFDVDTANFNGNEAPEVEIYGMRLTPEEEHQAGSLTPDDPRWIPLLPRVPCKPSSRHLYATEQPTSIYTHIKLHMIPDGGIGRFRVYGTIPAPPVGLGVGEHATSKEDTSGRFNVLDLAHVMNGGQVVFTSDQHFGIGPNVLLPGRGKDMGDGWETKRSRAPGHKDWLIIKLGEVGMLQYAEIDTAHFLGNFPESVELEAILFDGKRPADDDQGWTKILERSKTGPGRQHYFALQNVSGKPYSHVRVTMHPDGGIKRVRIIGRRASPLSDYSGLLPEVALPTSHALSSDKALPEQPSSSIAEFAGTAGAAVSSWFNNLSVKTPSQTQHGFLGQRHLQWERDPAMQIRANVLTSSAFAPYGDVIASPHSLAEPERPYKTVNQGSAQKYVSLSDVQSLYPASAQAKASIHVYRCKPQAIEKGKPFGIRVLERHQFTKQAFLPMTSTTSASNAQPSLTVQGQQSGYLVIVAKNGTDDLPDLTTLAAFIVSGEQGIAYGAGTWHHPMITLGTHPTDFAVVVHESEVDTSLNCDEVFWSKDVAAVTI